MVKLMIRKLVLAVVTALVSLAAYTADVVSDGKHTLSANEIRYLIASSPATVKEQLMDDEAARYQFLQNILQKRNLADAALAVPPESDEYFEAFYASANALVNVARRRIAASLSIPDLESLAEERYRVEQERYARVPEYREVSHILLLCEDAECDADALRTQIQDLRDKLLAGDSFEEAARSLSDDIASARRGGRLSGGIYAGSDKVDERFLEAVFALDNVGDLSPIVRTQFGLHLIRLETIEASFLRSFEEVREIIEQQLRAEYVGLATEEALKSYLPSEEMTINGPLFDQILNEIR